MKLCAQGDDLPQALAAQSIFLSEQCCSHLFTDCVDNKSYGPLKNVSSCVVLWETVLIIFTSSVELQSLLVYWVLLWSLPGRYTFWVYRFFNLCSGLFVFPTKDCFWFCVGEVLFGLFPVLFCIHLPCVIDPSFISCLCLVSGSFCFCSHLRLVCLVHFVL